MKLYKDAFVEVQGFNGPQAVMISPDEPDVFQVAGHRYRKNGRPVTGQPGAPKIMLVYSRGCSLHEVKQAS